MLTSPLYQLWWKERRHTFFICYPFVILCQADSVPFSWVGGLQSSPHKELSVEIPKEVTSSITSDKGPIIIRIQNEGGVAEISKEQGKGPIIENIKLNLPSEVPLTQKAQAAQPEKKPEIAAPVTEFKQLNVNKVIPESKCVY